jgi:hypothetical protein
VTRDEGAPPKPRFNWPLAVRTFGAVLAAGAILGVIGISMLEPDMWGPAAQGTGNEGWRIPILSLIVLISGFAGAVMAAIPAIVVAWIVGSSNRKTPPAEPLRDETTLSDS